jgi:hypothetical protein
MTQTVYAHMNKIKIKKNKSPAASLCWALSPPEGIFVPVSGSVILLVLLRFMCQWFSVCPQLSVFWTLVEEGQGDCLPL